MKSAALTNGSGPGSSIALSPTSIRVRDAIIEKFIDKSLEELNDFLTSALDTERDEAKRIGILAARVYILRTRINKITEFNQNSMIPSIEPVSPHELVHATMHLEEPVMKDETQTESIAHLEEWNELMTIEDGEVNGVRIPRGVAITVGKEDAARLIETGKAELISEESSAEPPISEEDALTNASDKPDGDDITKSKTEISADTQLEQTNEISSDEDDAPRVFSAEDTGRSSAETRSDDSETDAQEPATTEDVQEPATTEDVQELATTEDVQELATTEDVQDSDDADEEAKRDDTNLRT